MVSALLQRYETTFPRRVHKLLSVVREKGEKEQYRTHVRPILLVGEFTTYTSYTMQV